MVIDRRRDIVIDKVTVQYRCDGAGCGKVTFLDIARGANWSGPPIGWHEDLDGRQLCPACQKARIAAIEREIDDWLIGACPYPMSCPRP